MHPPSSFLSPSEAARRLGISAKALRLYEQRGLMAPARTAVGWREYGPKEMARAAEIVALRALGFSLAQVGRVLDGNAQGLEPVLAAHQDALEAQWRRLARTVEQVRGLRGTVARGQVPTLGELAGLLAPAAGSSIAFDLPWPWGGERFELRVAKALTYITGPLGSGKTRLAQCIAEALPNAVFLGLDRTVPDQLAGDPARQARLDETVAGLVDDGATPSDALAALLSGLDSEAADAFVVDLVEQGLDQATQEALVAWLRRRGAGAPRLFMLTRSSAILDLTAVGPDEAILLCPANHSPPSLVMPCPGAPGYEALASCLASPEVRARTAGVMAWRPAG